MGKIKSTMILSIDLRPEASAAEAKIFGRIVRAGDSEMIIHITTCGDLSSANAFFVRIYPIIQSFEKIFGPVSLEDS